VEALASLRAQTLPDHEVVAVDDGSGDRSPDVLAEAARADPRLRVLRPGRVGLVAALNLAADAARAPLVARMDADDVAHPQRLRLQAKRLRADPELAILATRVRLVGGVANQGMRDFVAWSNALVDHDEIVRDLLVESPLVHPSVMLRRAALARLGGYRDDGGPEDYDLWLRACAAGLRFAKLAQELLDWRDSPGRLTRADPRYAPARFRARKIEALEAGPLGPGRALVIWGAGRVGKSFARELRERGHCLRAFVEVDPRKLGQTIHGAPVLSVAEAAALRGPLHLAAVGQPGARERIRAEARRLGLVEGADLVAVA
jgi:hypothetical protein